MVVELDQLGDRGVEPQGLHVVAHAGDGVMQQPLRVERCVGVEHGQIAGLLVDDVAPQSLQEAVHADDVARLPRARGIERAHGHLVETQGVGTEALADVVGRNRVLQALAHLAPLAGDGQIAVEVVAVALDDFGGVDVDLSLVLERGSQDVALVEQPVVGLLRRDVTQVEQHLVPEACVQQVQHGVFNATDVEVDAAGMLVTVMAFGLWAHPVALDLGIDELLLVGRVEVAQFVPTTAGPLRHDVGVAPVVLRPVTQIELDMGPPLQPIERALRVRELVVGVECARREAVGLGQNQRQFTVGKAVRVAVDVVHDGERFAPVALPAEQPVAQLVGDCRFAVAVFGEPLVGQLLGRGDTVDPVEVE